MVAVQPSTLEAAATLTRPTCRRRPNVRRRPRRAAKQASASRSAQRHWRADRPATLSISSAARQPTSPGPEATSKYEVQSRPRARRRSRESAASRQPPRRRTPICWSRPACLACPPLLQLPARKTCRPVPRPPPVSGCLTAVPWRRLDPCGRGKPSTSHCRPRRRLDLAGGASQPQREAHTARAAASVESERVEVFLEDRLLRTVRRTAASRLASSRKFPTSWHAACRLLGRPPGLGCLGYPASCFTRSCCGWELKGRHAPVPSPIAASGNLCAVDRSADSWPGLDEAGGSRLSGRARSGSRTHKPAGPRSNATAGTLRFQLAPCRLTPSPPGLGRHGSARARRAQVAFSGSVVAGGMACVCCK